MKVPVLCAWRGKINLLPGKIKYCLALARQAKISRNFTSYPAIYPGDHSRSHSIMEFRTLGRSGLKVPVLSLGTATFGAGSEVFRAIGQSGVAEATRLVDICLEAGAHMFDTADL